MAHALGLLLGYGADAVVGDPRRWHPVAGFGRMGRMLESRMHADDRRIGAVYTATLVGGAVALGAGLDRATRNRGVLNTLAVAAATWSVLGGRSLAHEAHMVQTHLRRDDLPSARRQVTHLVGRDPSRLDADGIARATVESVAENTSDAVVAPLFWGAVAGPAGLLGYRAANTLDAMVGHRSVRYRDFGWATARFDDLLNLVPSRLSAVLAAAMAPTVGGRWRSAVAAWRRDAGRHPSPNAGPVEAAFAGALGISIGGVNTYGGVEEDRGTMGHGPPATPADISRTTRLSAAVGTGSVIVCVLVASARQRRRR
jgi:adenosylcobinamide-phosphate synthase